MTEADAARGGIVASVSRACAAVDRVNDAVGRWLGPVIILVTGAILWEVVARTAFVSTPDLGRRAGLLCPLWL